MIQLNQRINLLIITLWIEYFLYFVFKLYADSMHAFFSPEAVYVFTSFANVEQDVVEVIWVVEELDRIDFISLDTE